MFDWSVPRQCCAYPVGPERKAETDDGNDRPAAK
jgi:hypothetical protein